MGDGGNTSFVTDTVDGGTGGDLVLDALNANRVTSVKAVGKKWLTAHATKKNGKTLLKVAGQKRRLPDRAPGPHPRS